MAGGGAIELVSEKKSISISMNLLSNKLKAVRVLEKSLFSIDIHIRTVIPVNMLYLNLFQYSCIMFSKLSQINISNLFDCWMAQMRYTITIQDFLY